MIPIPCHVQDHSDNVMNLVCLDEECSRKGLICSFCLLTTHKNHVHSVFPLKALIAQLNKANNPKKQQELQDKGNAIFEKHHNIKLTFRNNLIEMRELLSRLEKDIEKSIKQLDLEADLFIGDAFESSMQILNSENLTKFQIDSAIEKIEPLIKMSDGHIWMLRENDINKQAQKLIKTAEILERESKHWFERSLQELHKLESCCQSHQKMDHVQIKESQNRFGLLYEQWNLKDTDAVSFKSKLKNDIWLSGAGLYEITKYPEGELIFKVSIFEGNLLNKKSLIYEEQIEVSDNDIFHNHVGKIFFQKAIKIQPDRWYSIALKPSDSCLSYYGANGMVETQEFVFDDPQFSFEYINNSTNTIQGALPLFYYEG